MKLGLREANQHFSRAIKAVRAGKEVVLTDRGRPIAVITPIREAPDPETVLKRMADAGSLHKLRKGRPYHEALYARERPRVPGGPAPQS